jgi:CheY-like chemotaxis protein
MTFKVLVVDDQLTMREVTRLALQEMGVRNIIDAENGDDAFKKATTQPLDMIISDFNMPGMDGLGLLRAVRGHPAVRKLPFILVTGRGDKTPGFFRRLGDGGGANTATQHDAGMLPARYDNLPTTCSILLRRMSAVNGFTT